MADDQTKNYVRDRSTGETGHGYEVAQFAERHNITIEQAQELIQLHGEDLVSLEKAAQKLGTGPGSSTSDLA